MAATFTGFLVLVATFNVWVDPYRIWNLPIGLAEDAPRPRAAQQESLVKSRGIARVRPVAVVLGNSRAEVGFDPLSPAWPESLRPVYNAAIPGSGVAVSAELLERAAEAGRLRYAVIGLEFLDFLTDPEAPLEAAPPATHPEDAVSAPRWLQDLKLALSLDTLLDAVSTLAQRDDSYAADVTRDGFNPLGEYVLYVREEGYGALFRQRDFENARAYRKLPKAIFARGSSTSDSWRALDRILGIAREHRIDVRFVIYPYHAHILEMFHQAELLPAFEAWKKHLAARLDDAAAASQTGCRLWDFSGYNAYSTESVPEASDRRTLVKWYWESGHFKRELGNRMLARMLGGGETSFGSCLTPANVDAQNLRLRQDRDRYVSDSPRTATLIAQLLRAAAP